MCIYIYIYMYMYDIMPRDEPDISRLLVPPKWPQLCD